MIKILKADEPSERQKYFTGLTRGRSRQPSALPFEVRVLHGFLLGFYKCNSLLAPSMQTMWAARQSDGTRTGRLFLLRWTKSHVDKPLQKGNAVSVLLRRSGPWKNNTNKFECHSKVPHVITEDATCSSSWFRPKSFSSSQLLPMDHHRSTSRTFPCLYIPNMTITRINQQWHFYMKKCMFC